MGLAQALGPPARLQTACPARRGVPGAPGMGPAVRPARFLGWPVAGTPFPGVPRVACSPLAPVHPGGDPGKGARRPKAVR